ncbi:MAG TPA: hypothetical protein VJ046_00010 [Candidatus Paceibacterota bacterium]|nr:hypothetical protein [Candidatus Paceibacterota bacterium]
MRREPFPIVAELSPDKLTPAEEKAFELLRAEHDKTAIDMDDFEGVEGYSGERIKKDKGRVARKKREIKEMGTEPTRKAQLLEMVLTDQIELSNWFGQDTYTIIPAEYDDLFHGVDLALEIEDESAIKHLALGIDATSSAKKVREKLKKIKDHIADGTLTAMEYFHSDDHNPDFYGTMRNIPQVVIGADGKTIRDLGELWMSAYGLARLRQRSGGPALSPEAEESQKQRVREAKEKLASHRAQFLLLEEIKMQLVAFRKFAIEESRVQEAKGSTQLAEKIMQAANKFESTLNLINSVLQEKDIPDREDVFRNSEDRVFQSLSEAVSDFENL